MSEVAIPPLISLGKALNTYLIFVFLLNLRSFNKFLSVFFLIYFKIDLYNEGNGFSFGQIFLIIWLPGSFPQA